MPSSNKQTKESNQTSTETAEVRQRWHSPRSSKISHHPSASPKKEPSSSSAGMKWHAGAAFVIPQGIDMSFTRARLLEKRIEEMGGTIAPNAKEAEVVIVPRDITSQRLRKEFLQGRYDSIAKVTPDWLSEAIKGSWTDPWSGSNPYLWAEPEHIPTLAPPPNDNHDDAIAMAMSELKERKNSSAHLVDDAELIAGKESKDIVDNSRLISEFSRAAELCTAQGDKWRAKSYNQAVAILRSLDFTVTSSDQIRDRKGIGPKMARHVDEILQTGSYAKLDTMENNPETSSTVELMQIYGVGKAWAKRLFHLGYPTVKSIREGLRRGDSKLSILSENQRIGVELYDELIERIPRWEIERIRDSIKRAIETAYPPFVSKNLTVEAVGSYRRGKHSCGDCDILISLPTQPNKRVSLIPLVNQLELNGLVVNVLSHLTTSTPIDGSEEAGIKVSRPHELVDKNYLVSPINNERELESETFMGICKLNKADGGSGIHHRIDIKSYAYQSYPFALLYFTGSSLFSRNMRDYAQKKKGMKLTDRGLYPHVGDVSRSTMHVIICESEEDIFKALGLFYTAPEDRNYDELFELPSEKILEKFKNAAVELKRKNTEMTEYPVKKEKI